MEIVPGILVKTLKELKEELQKLSWAKKVHIDIMDGKFVKAKTIQALTLKKALPKMDMQIHYMGKKPHKCINAYSRMGAKEFIFHAESTKHAAETLEEIRMKGMKAGIAFNPETKISHHRDVLVHADLALVMTVHPGLSGQRFLKSPLHKIDQIKRYNPIIKIGVDGGVHQNTCSLVKKARAEFAVATSAISNAQYPKKAYNRLKK